MGNKVEKFLAAVVTLIAASLAATALAQSPTPAPPTATTPTLTPPPPPGSNAVPSERRDGQRPASGELQTCSRLWPLRRPNRISLALPLVVGLWVEARGRAFCLILVTRYNQLIWKMDL
jgi:hypothetical protein